MVNFAQPHNSNFGVPPFSEENLRIPIVSPIEENFRVLNIHSRLKNSHLSAKCSRNTSWNQFFDIVPISDLISIQRTSFQYFIKQGLFETIKKNNSLVFSNFQDHYQVSFFPEWIQFRKPEYTPKQALYFGKTYGCSIYIPLLLKTPSSSHQKIEWVLLGFLPLMTKHGHFIINGIPRVVLHQMVRNPGVYLLSKDSRTRVPTIRIVPQQGSWINITVDKKYRFWVTTRILKRKVSILIFLQALGVSLAEIYRRLEYSELLQASLLKDVKPGKKQRTRQENILLRAGLHGHPLTQVEAWKYLYAHCQEYTVQGRDQSITDETARDFFWNRIWNKNNRDLGRLGRDQFRRKVASTVSLTETHLTEEDMVLATQALLNFVIGKKLPDDVDSLTNKRVRGCGEFLQDELTRGLRDFDLLLTRKFSGTTSTSQLDFRSIWRFNRAYLSKSISKAWKSFFTSGTLSQFMDETNPLSEVTHKRRLTVLGQGGVNSKQSTIQIRGIHPTFYGRFCPIETPEGQNAGLVNSFTVYSNRTIDGKIETPYYPVYKGQVQKFVQPVFVTPDQEESYLLAPADILRSKWESLPKTTVPVRKNWSFEYGSWKQISHQSIDLLQIISVATSLIPFLEHNDANRALMGSNMQRQAVPLLKPENALVGTGLETRVIADVNHCLQASQAAYITSINAKQIEVYQPNKQIFPSSKVKKLFTKAKALTLVQKTPAINGSKKGLSTFATKFLFQQSLNGKFEVALTHPKFPTPLSLNQNKLPFIGNLRQGFFKTKKRKFISSQQNCLEPFFILSSLNFFFQNQDFFQKNLEKQKVLTFDNNSNLATSVKHQYVLETFQRTNQSTLKMHRPCVEERTWIQKADLLADGAASHKGKVALGKNVLVAYLPWEGYNFEDAILISERLVTQDVYTSLHIDYYEVEVKNTQYGVEKITSNIPIAVDDPAKDVLRLQQLNSRGLVEVGTWVEEGDYLVGKVSPSSPKAPSIQQQYEKLYNVIMQRENSDFRNTSLRVPKGVEGFVLSVDILPPKEADVLALVPKNSILHVRIALLQRRKIQVGDKMAGRHGNKGVISKILPIQDMPYLADGTPIDIVLNPLGVPSRMNVGQILEALLGLAGKYLNESYTINLFDEKFGGEASRSFVYSKLYEASVKTANPWLFEPAHPGKMRIYDGRTGLPFDQPITVGYPYMLKLVHLVDDKIHARATGPYSAVTQQPVRGRSRNGGQRLGEMEVWALQAYGAAATLQELLTIKSDDVEGRKETVFRIYTHQSLKFGHPESFKVLLRELQSLCFDLHLFTQEGKKKQRQSINILELEKLGIY